MSQIDLRPVLKTFSVRSAAIFGFAFVALFVQTAQAQGPLNYFKNYFVTGDYVVGGVGLAGSAVNVIGNNPPTVAMTSSIALNGVPCTSGPGLFARVVSCTEEGAVPADIIAAFLYWQTIESTTTPSSGYGSFDATFPANPFVGLALGNPQIPACSGGGTSGKYMHNYRADVLKYLPINNTANVRMANGTQAFTLASGDTTTQFVGATLVVVYRLVTPGNPKIAPLRSVVLYDGAFTGTASSSLNQTMGGFYQASSDADAKMTQIVGNGQPISNRKEKQTLLVNGSIPEGVPSDPFEGAQGANWDNYTFNYDLAPNASSVNTQVVLKDDCLSWGAIITSTKVRDSDFDGLLDVWETSGLYFDPGVRNDGTTTPPVPATFGTCANNSPGCVNLPAMGANPFVPDIFVQVDWMQGSYGAPHTHIPQLDALNMVGSAFKSHGINLHFDVGNNYQTPQSPYIIPATYAQGGNVIPESGNLLCPNSNTSVCAFPQQESDYSLLGWKSGLDAIKNGDSVLGLLPLFAANRKDTFHYALFAHGIAATTPLSAPLAGSISGVGDLPGGDLMVTLGLWRSDTPAVDQVGTVLEQAGTLMHELGHNLDLKHGGWNDTPVCKPDYPSVMNYLYQVDGLTDSSGNEHIDYSRGLELPMSEDFLSSFFPMGLQQYRVRYFGPFNSATNTPGQASQVSCNGQLPSSFGTTEGPYVRLEGPAVSTPDWSNGTILPLGKIITSGLDINYDGTVGQTFFDSPDWISLNLQQVGSRPNANGLSLNVGISDIGISDIGISDIGISDIGISDIGISDIGISDIGISDIGTAQLGQDALGDQDFASYVLSGVNPPTLLTATVYVPSTTGGTGNLLNWTPPTAGQVLQYNIYRCNASGVACTPSSPALTNVPGGTATPTFTDTVNDFVDAGTTCPAASTCYNTTYNYYVTAVVTAVGKNVESGPSNTVSGEVNHLFVMGNISPQTVVYGSANPAITPNIYGNGSLSTSSVICVYSPAAPRNAGAIPYPIVCSGPATTSTTVGVTYNANYLSYIPSTLTITPLPITVTAAASTKVYDSTTSSTAIPTIAPATLPYGDVLTLTETYPSANVGTTYAMAPAAAASGATLLSNYNPTYVNSAANSVIKSAPASVTPNPATKIYGTSDPTLTGTLTGFFSADGVTATYSRTAGQTVAGSPYTISATLSAAPVAPAAGLSNYSITYSTANFTITPAPASVTPNASSKTYGTADQPLSGTLAGFVASDNVTATYTRAPGETVGAYAISATLSPLGVLGNYNITYGTAVFTIAPASQTITFGPLANMTYGDQDLTPGATASSGLPVTYTASGSCTVTNSGAIHLTNSGDCTVTASQPGNINYLAAPNVTQTFTVGTLYTSDPILTDFTTLIPVYATFNTGYSDAASNITFPYTPTAADVSAGTRVIGGGNTAPIVVKFPSAASNIRVFSNIDHFGASYDGYQYTISGSNDGVNYTPLFAATTVTGSGEPFTLGTFTGTAPFSVNNVLTAGKGPGGTVGYEADFSFSQAYLYYSFGASAIAINSGNADQELTAVGALP